MIRARRARRTRSRSDAPPASSASAPTPAAIAIRASATATPPTEIVCAAHHASLHEVRQQTDNPRGSLEVDARAAATQVPRATRAPSRPGRRRRPPGSPSSQISSPSAHAMPAVDARSSISPTVPTTGVGRIGPSGVSLYRLTLPDTTGRPSSAAALGDAVDGPFELVSAEVGLGGAEVEAVGERRSAARRCTATLRAPSMTAVAPARNGSRVPMRAGPGPSIASASARSVPFTRRSAASPAPGPTRVLVPFMWS